MKKVFLFCLIFTSFFLNRGICQNCPFKKDTVFYVSINIHEKNHYPLLTGGIIKDIHFLNNKFKNADTIIKSFFKEAIFITDPIMSISSCVKCFADTSEAKMSLNSSDKIIMEKFAKLNNTIIIKCKKRKVLQISFSKVVADFWVIPTDFSRINGLSVAYKLTPQLYKHDFYYGLKQMYDVLILSEKEKKFD